MQKLTNSLAKCTILLYLFFGTGLASAQTSETAITKHITFLASDKLKGRGTGTKEELKAAKYIAKQFKKIGLQPKGDKGTYLHQFGFRPTDPHGGALADAPNIYANNVVGYLDNNATHTVVIGAHYDHLGIGHQGSSLDAHPKGKIHNGADDNASGTSAVVELARYFAENNSREASNFLFICFSAEEMGLVGSKRFTEFPTIDLTTVNYMINMDMVGRLSTERGLIISGVGTAPEFVSLIQNTPFSHRIKQDSSGVGPSDHTSFYLKNIPVLAFFTGQHSDYHKPSDDIATLNIPGEKLVLDYIIKIVEQLDKKPKLLFQATQTKAEDTPKFTVTLGIMPDYSFDGVGVRVDDVRDNKPGKVAGLQKGDVIIRMGDMEIKDMKVYMKALSSYKKGDTTSITIKRGEEKKELLVSF